MIRADQVTGERHDNDDQNYAQLQPPFFDPGKFRVQHRNDYVRDIRKTCQHHQEAKHGERMPKQDFVGRCSIGKGNANPQCGNQRGRPQGRWYRQPFLRNDNENYQQCQGDTPTGKHFIEKYSAVNTEFEAYVPGEKRSRNRNQDYGPGSCINILKSRSFHWCILHPTVNRS